MPMQAEQWRGVKQPIDVVLADGTSSQVPPKALDVLLDNNRVLKFRRTSGWVIVGVDPVRSRRSSFAFDSYSGPERRHLAH